MSARRGFIASNVAQAGVTTAYNNGQGILLDGTGTLDAGAVTLPGSAYLSHIEIQCLQTGATAATLTFFLSWDSAGDYPASGGLVSLVQDKQRNGNCQRGPDLLGHSVTLICLQDLSPHPHRTGGLATSWVCWG